MSNYIRELISQGEHEQLDFKHSISDSKKIARSIAAFANTRGGKLLVGVRDNGSIAGINTDEEFYMIQAAADMYCKPTVEISYKPWVIEGKTILEISIPQNNEELNYAPDKEGNWKVYLRVNDQNLLANKIYLKVWNKKREKKGVLMEYSPTEKTLLHYLNEHDTISLSKFKKIAKISHFKAEHCLINLILFDVLEMNFTEQGVFYTLKDLPIPLD